MTAEPKSITTTRWFKLQKPFGQATPDIWDLCVGNGQHLQLSELISDRAYGLVEVRREGFPRMAPVDFVDKFFVQAQGIAPGEYVTRIEYRYLEVHAAPPVGSGQMPCCLRPVFEVAPWHRLTYDADAVTCPGAELLDRIREQVPA